MPPRSFSFFGFAEPTPAFHRITVGPDTVGPETVGPDTVGPDAEAPAGRALIDGVLVIPGLPVCRVRLKTTAAAVAPHAPGRGALVAAVRAALREDALAELPQN